jgi:hypothetical protein
LACRISSSVFGTPRPSSSAVHDDAFAERLAFVLGGEIAIVHAWP